MNNKIINDIKKKLLNNDMDILIIRMALELLDKVWDDHLDVLSKNYLPLLELSDFEIDKVEDAKGTVFGEYMFYVFNECATLKDNEHKMPKLVPSLLIGKFINSTNNTFLDLLKEIEIEECDNALEKEFLTQTLKGTTE